MDLLCNVLLEREDRYVSRFEAREVEQGRRSNPFRLPESRIGETDVEEDRLETAPREFGLDAETNCYFNVMRWGFAPLAPEDEVVAEIEGLSLEQVLERSLHIALPGKIHVFRGPRAISETKIERESPFEYPAIRGGVDQTSEETFEDDDFAQP